jgi:hypothetical protein
MDKNISEACRKERERGGSRRRFRRRIVPLSAESERLFDDEAALMRSHLKQPSPIFKMTVPSRKA